MENLVDLLKSQIIECIKTGQETGRDILRLVLSEAQRIDKYDNETIIKIIAKLIKSNDETLKAGGHNIKLIRENEILKKYLPQCISKEELKQHLSEILPQLSTKTGNAKIGLALQYLKRLSLVYSMTELRELLDES